MRLQVAVFYLLLAAVIWTVGSTRGLPVRASALAERAPGVSGGVAVDSMAAPGLWE